MSGVQSLRILDSYELVPTHLPEPSASIHRERDFEEPAKAGGGAVVAESKRSYDACELLEVRLLAREQRVDMELGNQLEPDATARVALHRDREASFSVYITRDVAVQPFLLIVRTRHVVTIVNARSDAHDE